MRRVLAAFFAKLLQTQLFLDLLLVSKSMIVHFLANFALECDEIVLRHKIQIKIKSEKLKTKESLRDDIS